LEACQPENVGCFWNDFFQSKIGPMRLGGFRRIDTQMDKSRGRIRNCPHIKANRASVVRKYLTDIRADFTNPQRIHPPLKKDPKSPIFEFVSEGGTLAAVHQVIHPREGKDALNFSPALSDPEKPVATLEFAGGFKD
jgi:hypothetical protein